MATRSRPAADRLEPFIIDSLRLNACSKVGSASSPPAEPTRESPVARTRCRHGQGGAIKVILKVPLPESDVQLFLCNECIESLPRSAAAEWLMRGDDG